jgi:pyruvate,water dikinase
MKERFIAWLSELSKSDGAIVGGKGANLGEMYNAGFPVPPAFAVTTYAYDHFLGKTGVRQQIDHMLSKIDKNDTKALTEKAKEIRDLVISTPMPEDLEKEILEAYGHFNVNLDDMKGAANVMTIMKTAQEPIFVSVRSSATAEDLSDASFAGQQDSFINVKGNAEVILHVKKVFASTFTARAIFYRISKGFDAHVGISAIVQRMINSDKSGVMFSVDPVKQDNILIEAVFGQGEGIVSGRIKPDGYVVSRDLEILSETIAEKKVAIVRDSSGITKTVQLTPEISNKKVLKTHEVKQLAEFALKLEKHYNKPQDIEFSIEDGNIFILQTRPITTIGNKKEAQELSGQILVQGLGASPGVASGIVRIVHSMDDLDKVKDGDVLVTEMTNPDMVVTMQKASAIVTDEGGITAHAAIVSREMGIPAVVGTGNATQVLEEGKEVTVDGANGKVYLGRAENKKVEILPIVHTKTKIKVLVDLPQFAERAAKTNADGVGLVRMEGLIAMSGKHPMYYKDNNKIDEYQTMLRDGFLKIAENFPGKEVWVRTSDIRSDEYSNLQGAPKTKEGNPMLGFHGIRFSLKHEDLFRAELGAMFELAKKGFKFGVMFPQVISPEEVKAAKVIMKDMGMLGHENVKVGAMIETPAATTLIKDICDVGIDFISFGTNDLTQFTLAIDRGNDQVQYIYDEMNWAVLKQISKVIRECHSRKPKIETSICGQAGSKKEMVEFLVKQGIDSISVNADVAHELSVLIKSMEDAKPTSTVQGKVKIEPLDNISDIQEKIDEKESERVAETIEKREVAELSTTVEEVKNQDEEGTATEDVSEVFKE